MKRWFSLLLLIGALLGLLGQEAAFARAVPIAQAEQTAAAAQPDGGQMSPECAEMMSQSQQPPQPDTPCQGMTPDCVAKMGCAVPVTLIPSFPGATPARHRLLAPSRMHVAPLVGREISPEPHPPANLG